jgi:hypothetical protein
MRVSEVVILSLPSGLLRDLAKPIEISAENRPKFDLEMVFPEPEGPIPAVLAYNLRRLCAPACGGGEVY